MEKIAVIGSNSFSGSNFIAYTLENSSHSLIGISRSPEINPIFLPYKGKEDSRFKFFQGDINKDMDEIMKTLEQEEVTRVINYSAQGMVGQSWGNPTDWYQTNVVGVVSLVERLRKFGQLKKYVQISSPEIYGSCRDITEDTLPNPSTPYANSKAAADTHIQLIQRQFGFPADFVRSTNVYGAGMQLYRIIPRSVVFIKLGKKIKLDGGGKAIKSYIHIQDVCRGTLSVLEDDSSGEIYHFSPDKGISIENLVRNICRLLGKDFDQCVESIEERAGQDAQYIINSSKARKKFDWAPRIDINMGLEACVDWVNKNWEIIKTIPLDYVHKK